MGSVQSSINLGYIYEYGRIGEPDYAHAFECYSFTLALKISPEALYKLGDLYNRGKGIPQNKRKAFQLYVRSLDLAESYTDRAHPTLRIAKIIVDPKGDWEAYGTTCDPLKALSLFQNAEHGYRLLILNENFTYYKKHLEVRFLFPFYQDLMRCLQPRARHQLQYWRRC